MITYVDALREAMSLVASKPGAIVLGQAVAYPGTFMRSTLEHLPSDVLLELPVAEEMQLGMAIGIALAGGLPLCIYPRVNFLYRAMDQLVNHLDKLPSMGARSPRVLIRTAVPHDRPLDPGPQHTIGYDAADVLRQMLTTVRVVELDDAASIVAEYDAALRRPDSTILIERMDMY